jgi:hypothetical protein
MAEPVSGHHHSTDVQLPVQIWKGHIDFHTGKMSCCDAATLSVQPVNLKPRSMQQLLLSPLPHLPP